MAFDVLFDSRICRTRSLFSPLFDRQRVLFFCSLSSRLIYLMAAAVHLILRNAFQFPFHIADLLCEVFRYSIYHPNHRWCCFNWNQCISTLWFCSKNLLVSHTPNSVGPNPHPSKCHYQNRRNKASEWAAWISYYSCHSSLFSFLIILNC